MCGTKRKAFTWTTRSCIEAAVSAEAPTRFHFKSSNPSKSYSSSYAFCRSHHTVRHSIFEQACSTSATRVCAKTTVLEWHWPTGGRVSAMPAWISFSVPCWPETSVWLGTFGVFGVVPSLCPFPVAILLACAWCGGNAGGVDCKRGVLPHPPLRFPP